jgi:hypothetical protein
LIIGLSVGGVVVLGAVVTVLIIVLAGSGEDSPKSGRVSGYQAQQVRKESDNNLHKIGIAFHNFNDAYGRLPPAIVFDKNGKPLYSWRVLLLPYLEQGTLYNQFHLDEPWDSPHNAPLSKTVVSVYSRPGMDSHMTFYQVFNGPGAVYNLSNPMPPGALVVCGPSGGKGFESASNIPRIPATFLDGTSNTILMVEADESVPWAKPADIPYDQSKPLPKLGGLYSDDTFLVLLADGSRKTINRKTISDTTLRNAINPADGNPLGSDW